jgi:DNA-binding NarL/FixJ family response regulator
MPDTFPLRVLIIDNHPDFWQAARWALDQDPHFSCVAEVTSAEEALQRLEQEPIDLVLLGLRLPDSNSFETARQLRSQQRALQIVLVAADLQEEHRRQARRADIQACLVKDEFNAALLAEVLALSDVE